MKLAFIFGPFSTGNRPLDFNTLWTSERGLTGSDLGITITAKEMTKFGHDVSLYIDAAANQPVTWEGVKIYNLNQRVNITASFDAVISWSEPDVLRGIQQGPVRIVCQMLNDFPYCAPGYDQFVDIWTAPCQMLIDHLAKYPGAPKAEKFVILPLGCDPSWYTDGPRVPGRVVWTSSADRGLHLLLQEWPRIKAAVPEAHLRVFYNFAYDHVINTDPSDSSKHPTLSEMGQRARYMLDAMKKLKPLGVESVGSISRARMEKELSAAMVLGYPCSTVAFTEGFSISILESCAAGVFPVISAQDCLGSIYGGTIPMVATPTERHMKEFSDLVIRGLTDEPYREEVIAKCKAFAEKHTWKIVTKKLEDIICKYRQEHGK
jgi:glycosyltransferase involved in cell wall biosynthesis